MSKLAKLTARSVEAAKPGTEIRDSEVRGLRLRVSPKGLRTFVLVTRYPGQEHASRRALTATTLAEAREEASTWKGLVRRGVDPQQEQKRQRHENLLKRENTFAAWPSTSSPTFTAASSVERTWPSGRSGRS